VCGKRVVEFGNQHVWVHAMKQYGINGPVARDWMLGQLGAASYTSIDSNGQDGAVKANLAVPFGDEFPGLDRGGYDIVTDVGTLEHIEGPNDNMIAGQPGAFFNAHWLCKVGGIMIHHLPPVGQWLDHCQIRYRDGLASALAEANGYEILFDGRITLVALGGHVDYLCVCVRRTSDAPFVWTDRIASQIEAVPR
jgi:hypothetical protein